MLLKWSEATAVFTLPSPDGTIAVTSEVGHGTTFTMRFPLTRARPEQLAS
jgi:hypothetical protein